MIPPDTVRWLVVWSLVLGNAIAFPWHAQSAAGPAEPVLQIVAADSESVEAQGTSAGQLDATDAYRLAILKMKGQLSVARALLQMRAPGADYHMQQRMQEIFRSAEPEFEQRGAPFTMVFLEQLEFAPEGDPAATLATIESASNALDGSFAQTGAMDAGSVLDLVEVLLREAVANYAEAVIDNEVVNLRQYQNGRGLATEAEALVRYHGGLKGRRGHEELRKAVVLIRQAWPGVIPPSIVFDPPSVAGRLEEAMAAMEELR